MKPSEQYPIERYIFTNNRCYKANKRRVPTGIQVHSVGCKGTTRDRWRRWDTDSISKCPNAFIDLGGIMQTLDWDVRPWLSGSGKNGNANDWCVGFEICEPSASKDTPEAAAYLYGCVLYLCTELCKDYGISPDKVKCHCELHRDGVASNHADVNHWWGKKGTSWEPYTMDRLRRDIAAELGEEFTPVTHPTLRKGDHGDAVKNMQRLLNESGYSVEPDGAFGPATVKALKDFQRANGLAADGVCGPKTWAVLDPVEQDADAQDPVAAGDTIDKIDQIRAKILDAVGQLDELEKSLRGD